MIVLNIYVNLYNLLRINLTIYVGKELISLCFSCDKHKYILRHCKYNFSVDMCKETIYFK